MIGLDLGTTNCKALACDAAGRVVHTASRRMPLLLSTGGQVEYDAVAVWEIASALLKDVVRALPRADSVRAIAVTSVGEAGVPCGDNNEVLYPAIAWFDARSAPQAEALEARMGVRALREITGLPSQPFYTIHKLEWLREHDPSVFSRIRRWYFMADYAVWRLSGEWVTDPSLASRSRVYDIRRGRWSPEILESAQIPASILPPVVPSGSGIGRLRPEVAEDLGVPREVVVGIGGHDHICASLGSGVAEPGDILDSMGTAEAFLTASDAPPGPEVSDSGFSVGRHVVEGRYYLLGAIDFSGGAVEWIAHITGMPIAELMAHAAAVQPGAEGLCFLAHLRGSLSPVMDPLSMGAFLGLRDVHGPSHLVRAVLEGLSFEAAANVQALEQITDRAGVLWVTGGAARLPLWLAIKAAMLDRPLEVLATTECAALGAALLAGVAAGVYGNATEAMHAGLRTGLRVEPDAALAKAMAVTQRVYCDLYRTVTPFHHRLRADIARMDEQVAGT